MLTTLGFPLRKLCCACPKWEAPVGLWLGGLHHTLHRGTPQERPAGEAAPSPAKPGCCGAAGDRGGGVSGLCPPPPSCVAALISAPPVVPTAELSDPWGRNPLSSPPLTCFGKRCPPRPGSAALPRAGALCPLAPCPRPRSCDKPQPAGSPRQRCGEPGSALQQDSQA